MQPRHYTLNTAGHKTVYVHKRQYGSGEIASEISLHHLYSRMFYGQSLAEIWNEFPRISRSKLLLARSFFYACNPEMYHHRNTESLKVLVDENVDEHIVTDMARRAFGRATHVSFEGLADSKDIDLWKFAMRHDINLILSKDRARVKSRPTMDLTLCAEISWHYRLKSCNWMASSAIEKMPRILHIMDGSLKGEDIAKIIHAHKEKVFELFEEASSPTIQIHEGNVKPGKNILELVAEGQFEKLRDQRDNVVKNLLNEFGLDHIVSETASKEERKVIREIAAQLKRIAEHEMLEQLIRERGQMTTNEDMIKKVKRVLMPETAARKLPDLSLVIDDYKKRGIGSVMAPQYRSLVAA